MPRNFGFKQSISRITKNLHRSAHRVDSKESYVERYKKSLLKKGKKQGKKQGKKSLTAGQKTKLQQLYKLVKEENHYEEPLPAVLHASKRTFPRVLLDYVGFRIPVKISAPNYAIHDLDLRHDLHSGEMQNSNTFEHSYRIAKHFGQNLVNYIVNSGTLEARTKTATVIADWINSLADDHGVLWDYKLRVLSKFKEVPFEPIINQEKIKNHLQNKMYKSLQSLLKEWEYYTTNFEYYIQNGKELFKCDGLKTKIFTTKNKIGKVILEGNQTDVFLKNGIFLDHAGRLFGENTFTKISHDPKLMESDEFAFSLDKFCKALNRHHIIQYWRGVQMTVIKLMKVYHHIVNLKPVFEQNIVAYRAMMVDLVNSTESDITKKCLEELERMSTFYSDIHSAQSSTGKNLDQILTNLSVTTKKGQPMSVNLLFHSDNSGCREAHQQAEKLFIETITNEKVKELHLNKTENSRYAKHKPMSKQSFTDSILTYKNEDKYCVLVTEIYNAMEFPNNYELHSIADEKKIWSYSRRIKVMTKKQFPNKSQMTADGYIALLTQNNFLEFPLSLANKERTALAGTQPEILNPTAFAVAGTTTFTKLPTKAERTAPKKMVYFDDNNDYTEYKKMYDADSDVVDATAQFIRPKAATPSGDTMMKEKSNVRPIEEISGGPSQ